MRRTGLLPLVILALALFSTTASANNVPIATLNFDVVGLNVAAFDITNFTGPNSSVFPDPTFPVSTPVSLTNLDLTVYFASGPPQTFGPTSGYFTLAPDGISFNGTPLSTVNAITKATLTADFSPTAITLNDGTNQTLSAAFSVMLTDVNGPLQDQDFVLISGSTGGTTPEPTSIALMASGLLSMVFLRRRFGGNDRRGRK